MPGMSPVSHFSSSVAVVYLRPESLPYPAEAFAAGVQSVLDQDAGVAQIIVVDGRGAAAKADFLPAGVDAERIEHVCGTFATRAALCRAGLAACTTDYVLLVACDRVPVRLRRSAAQTFLMAATRGEPQDLVYADYDRQEADGQVVEVHLLDWHPGRLRDTFDIGLAVLYRTAALRVSGAFEKDYKAAEWYDARLRVSESGRVAHIANRYAGALYTVAAQATAHNVFAYLLSGRDTQLEMEDAVTQHLRRTGTYLAPGAHVQPIAYTAEEQARSADCVASVVTPVNQRPEFIGRAIESVQAQTESRVEMIVVVNGGETDPTAAEVRRYMPGGDRYAADKPPVRLLVTDVNNLGLCLNAGIAAARGQIYVQLDSDDRLKPNAVAKILAEFEADPTAGMVVGSYEVWTLDATSGALRRNEEIPVVTHDEWTADNGRNNLLRINGAGAPRAARIKAIAEAGWFGVNDTPQSRNYGEDYDLVQRISERHTIARVWEPIYEVIRHAGGTDHAIDQATIDRNDNAKDQMRLEALERRRRLNQR